MNPFVRLALEQKAVKKMHSGKSNSRSTYNPDKHPDYSNKHRNYDNYTYDHSLEECILMERDLKIINFLETLERYTRIINDEDAKKYAEKIEELKLPIKISEEELKEKENKLTNESYEIKYNYDRIKFPTYKFPTYIFEPSEKQNTNPDIELEPIKLEHILKKINSVSINGIETSENSVKKTIEAKQKEYENYEKKIREFNKREFKKQKRKLKIKEKFLKMKCNRREDRRTFSKLIDIQRDIARIREQLKITHPNNIKMAEDIKKQINTLKSLTPEQTKMIDDFLKSVEKFNKEVDNFPRKECHRSTWQIKEIYHFSSEQIYTFESYDWTHENENQGRLATSKALERMIEEGVITEEDILYISENIQKIDEMRRNSEYSKQAFYSNWKQEELCNFTKLFLYEMKEEYELEKSKSRKTITPADIAETAKEKGISTLEIDKARELTIKMAKKIFEDRQV